MNNNDIFKKLRVALQLRDDQIVEILELVDFRMSKGEIGNFFRTTDHPNYVECGDQVLRNFLNGLVIHLRGTKENPKNANEVLAQNRAQATAIVKAPAKEFTPRTAAPKNTIGQKTAPKKPGKNFAPKKPTSKINPVEKVKFNNGKKKNN
jgi:hypothetical protein